MPTQFVFQRHWGTCTWRYLSDSKRLKRPSGKHHGLPGVPPLGKVFHILAESPVACTLSPLRQLADPSSNRSISRKPSSALLGKAARAALGARRLRAEPDSRGNSSAQPPPLLKTRPMGQRVLNSWPSIACH